MGNKSNKQKLSRLKFKKKKLLNLNSDVTPRNDNPDKTVELPSYQSYLLDNPEVPTYKTATPPPGVPKNRNAPKRLSVLCKNVIKKYKLEPKPVVEKKKFIAEATSCTVVGGKPLRKRKTETTESTAPTPSTSKQPPKKKKTIKSDDKLLKPVKSRKVTVVGSRSGRGRPSKVNFPEISVAITAINPEPELIRIKNEFDTSADEEQDPFAPDEAADYTVVIKEEFEVELERFPPKDQKLSIAQPTADTPRQKVIMPKLICTQNVGQSSSLTSTSTTTYPPLMTVVADEMQIFANSVAEQLRAFPTDRAMLLQLDIQTMLDNERQLLLHES